jgi:hypothetical protein
MEMACDYFDTKNLLWEGANTFAKTIETTSFCGLYTQYI